MFSAEDPRGRLLTSLGFTVPADLAPFVGPDGAGGTLPAERASAVTPLSIPFLLDGLVPQLAAAVDGDPSTAAA